MEVDSTTKKARIVYSTIKGNKYKGKSYFVFKNGIGYVVKASGSYNQLSA